MFSLDHFLRLCLVVLIGTYFCVSSFCLILCFCFYVLGKSAASPSLKGVHLCRICSVRLRSALPTGQQSQMLRWCLLCGLHTLSCCGRAAAAAAVHWWAGIVPGMALEPSHGSCWALMGKAGPQNCYGAWPWMLPGAGGQGYCPISCNSWLGCRGEQGSLQVCPLRLTG